MNTDLFTDINLSNSTLHMHTNPVTKKTTLQGDVKKFGDVWYEPTQMANTFEL